MHEKTVSSEQADIDPTDHILAEFANFEQEDYAFVPHSSGWLSWIIRRIWIIPLLLLFYILTINLIAIIMSGEIDHIFTLATTRGEWKDAEHENSFQYRYFDGKTSTYFYYLECTNIKPQGNSKSYFVSFKNGHIEEHNDLRQPYCIRLEVKQAGLMLFDALVYIGPLFFIFLLDALIYTHFIQAAPKSFYGLARAGRLKPGEAVPTNRMGLAPRSWRTYSQDLESALQSRWGNILGIFFVLFAYILSAFFMQGRNSIGHIRSGFLPDMLNEILLYIILPGILGLLVGIFLWVLVVVGLYIWWLTPTFTLDIQIGHSDGTGGLKRIGDILLPIALICIIPGIVFGVWGISGILSISIPAVLYLVYAGSAFLLVAAAIGFFLPAWKIHTDMDNERTEYLEEANTHILPVKKRLRELVTASEENSSEGHQLRERLDLLDKLYPDNIHFRSWPFSTQTLTVFSFGQVVSLLGIYSNINNLLDLFNNLSPGSQ